jgi:hypothetical protein
MGGRVAMTKITTNIVGFSEAEWRMIRGAARSLQLSGASAGTLIFPGRPEIYRLDRRGGCFLLRLSSEEEAAVTLIEQARTR